MAIGAVIGLISTVFQAVRAFSSSDAPPANQPQQKADKLFAELDAMGQGAIQRADLEKAFDKIADKAAAGADKLFAKLDADGDGTITKREFAGSINQLADQLDHHYMRLRLHGQDAVAPRQANAGFTKDELTGLVSSVAGNFDKADADGDGRVSIREMRSFAMGHAPGTATAAADSLAGNQNVELMLQVLRLMQAYGVVGGTSGTTADSGTVQRVSDKV